MWRWLTMIVMAGTPLPMGAAMIDVREQVTVAEGVLVRLKDVARIVDGDPAQAAALGEITLGPSPAAGRSQRLSFDELRSRLQARGVNLAEIEFRGKTTTTITTAAAIPSPAPRQVRIEPTRIVPVKATRPPPPPTKQQQQQAEQLLQAAVQRAFRLTATESPPVRVSCTCDPEDVPLVLPISSERIRFAEPQLRLGTAQSITAHWPSDQGELQTIIVQVTTELLPRRLAVRHPIPAGYAIQPDDLEWVTGESDPQAITELAEAVGKETRQALRAGQLLTADLLATVPLIRPNDIVTVQVRRPGVTVRRMFKAQSGGALNDNVSLVAVDDPRLRVRGIVTGYHEATIVEQPTNSGAASPSGRQP